MYSCHCSNIVLETCLESTHIVAQDPTDLQPLLANPLTEERVQHTVEDVTSLIVKFTFSKMGPEFLKSEL